MPGNRQYSWGWLAAILPFMEQEAAQEQSLYGTMTIHLATQNANARAVMQQPIASYRCPSDNAPNTNNVLTVNSQRLATANYVGVHSSDHFVTPATSERAGCFVRDDVVRFRDIFDGTSNTLMVGERKWSFQDENGTVLITGSGHAYGVVCCGHSHSWRRGYQLGVGVYRLNLDGTNQAGQIYGSNVSQRGAQGFSSRHPGGAIFCLADASVRFVSDTIEGYFDNRGVQTDSNGSAATNVRRVIDTTWERVLSKQDGDPTGDY
jgi:hypothetical protein